MTKITEHNEKLSQHESTNSLFQHIYCSYSEAILYISTHRWCNIHFTFDRDGNSQLPALRTFNAHYSVDTTVRVKKIPPPRGDLTFFHFFTIGWEFLIDFLHTYYTFLSTLDYKFLSNYPQFWRSYVTYVARIKRDYTVHIICRVFKMSTIGRNACVQTFA